MKILLFGKNGQLGWELQRSLAPLGEVIVLGSTGTHSADFTNPSEVAATALDLRPDLIVNAAAYTSVDLAETDSQTAMLVNAITPGVLGEVAAQLDAWLVHYSTDYVFDGSGATPWREDDVVGPLNEYGRTKLAGEQNIRTAGCRHLIFRTSWVYAARGSNFPKTMLKLAQERDSLMVIDDQFGAPTGADLLADVSAHAIRSVHFKPELSGTYHVAPSGETTWYRYARRVIDFARAAGLPIKVMDARIRAVSTHEFSTPAPRPTNSRLDTTKLRRAFGLHLPAWETGLDRMLSELVQK